MEGKGNKAHRVKFYIERENWATQVAVIFMALSAVFRLIGCWGLWSEPYFAVTQIALPIAAALLFILLLMLVGRYAAWLTVLPVLMGVAFFILKSLTFTSWLHTVLCILLYLMVAVLYTATVFGLIRTKWLLVPLFALPFLYHIFVEDLTALRDTANPVSFAAGMQEMSVLCIMLALLFTALAMKKKRPPEVELPKMKAPKVLPPERLREQEPPQSAPEAEAETEA